MSAPPLTGRRSPNDRLSPEQRHPVIGDPHQMGRPGLSGPVEPGPAVARRGIPDDLLTLGLALLIAAALLPFQRIFIGPEWIRPVVGAAVLSLGIGWGVRRLDVGPITHLVMTLSGLVVFVTIAFLPATAAGGLLPTRTTLEAIRDLFLRGLELVELRPSPTFAEAGLLLLAVTGVWIVTYLADGMLFVLRSPLKAITAALVLWSVPLAVAPSDNSILVPTAAMLLAAGFLLLLGNAVTTADWGPRLATGTSGRRGRVVPVSGWLMLGVAALVGVFLASALPGYQARPVYTIRGGGGTTITTNPIVNIQDRLVAQNTGPVLQVDSQRPVYLRTTALDSFNEREEWTLSGTIGGAAVRGRVDDPPSIPIEQVEMQILVEGIETGAILAPTPYQTVAVTGPKASDMRYDQRLATLTVSSDRALTRGDEYRVTAALPQPSVDALRTVLVPAPSLYTDLPANVPDIARDLATEIVTTAGAATMFDQALAIQNRLRSWDYRITPTFGEGSSNLERFINGQQGYCEQFAGTMAVMLRSLGIPSRLAVGYTPGTQDADGLWTVTNANAHAWVEVDFGDMGWIAFEPTPRTDGNVLVPDGNSVVPSQTVAMQGGTADDIVAAGPGEIPLDQPSIDPRLLEEPLAPGDGADGAGGAGSSGGVPWVALIGLLGLVGVGATTVQRRNARSVERRPEDRINRARRHAERAGAAVGQARHPSETDNEYFHRISEGHAAGAALANPAARALYAPSVTVRDARTAEAAAGTIRAQLLTRATRRSRLKLAIRDRLPGS